MGICDHIGETPHNRYRMAGAHKQIHKAQDICGERNSKYKVLDTGHMESNILSCKMRVSILDDIAVCTLLCMYGRHCMDSDTDVHSTSFFGNYVEHVPLEVWTKLLFRRSSLGMHDIVSYNLGHSTA